MFPSPHPAHTLEQLTRYIRAPSALLRAVAQPLSRPGFIGSTALTPFVCVRPPSEQASRGAGSPPSHHPRMRLQGACDSDGMSEARACSCALNVAIDVCLALTRGLEAPCAAEKGGEWLYLDVGTFTVRFPVHAPAGNPD